MAKTKKQRAGSLLWPWNKTKRARNIKSLVQRNNGNANSASYECSTTGETWQGLEKPPKGWCPPTYICGKTGERWQAEAGHWNGNMWVEPTQPPSDWCPGDEPEIVSGEGILSPISPSSYSDPLNNVSPRGSLSPFTPSRNQNYLSPVSPNGRNNSNGPLEPVSPLDLLSPSSPSGPSGPSDLLSPSSPSGSVSPSSLLSPSSHSRIGRTNRSFKGYGRLPSRRVMAPHVGRIVKNIEGKIQTHTAPQHGNGRILKRKRRLNRTKKYKR